MRLDGGKQIVSEKLTEQITVKVSESVSDTFARLACVEGISSADLLRNLIDGYIQKKHDDFILLSRAFAAKENMDNRGNQ